MKKFLSVLILGACPFGIQGQLDCHDRPEYRELVAELRCVTCQNQNLMESKAPIAESMKDKICQMLDEGKRPEDIKAYFVEKYSDFVLYDPRFQKNTYLLWAGPFLFVGCVLLIFLRYIQGPLKGDCKTRFNRRKS